MTARISVFLILFFSVIFLPFWLYTIMIFGAMVYFSFFMEGIALFLLSDLLYGVKEAKFFGVVFISLFISILIFIILEIFKKKLKFYS